MIRKSDKDSLIKLGQAARTLMHEIKNPLSAMTIQSALLRSEIPQQFHGDLDLLDNEIKRLTVLTNNVGEFIKNPVGNLCEIELISFVSDIIKLFKCPVRLNTGSLSSVFIVFDKERARSVVENLIKNACESTLSKDPQVEVVIRQGKKKIVLEVCDRGDGIPSDIKENIFDPFFTTKANGSGIGLAISRQFVQAGKGSLKLIDRIGGGTVARVILPGKAEYKK